MATGCQVVEHDILDVHHDMVCLQTRCQTLIAVCDLGAEYPSPKQVNLSIMVGLYKPQKVKGYLLSY